MMTKKKRKMIMIGIPVLVLIIIIAIFILLYCTTDMFKSNQTLFFKYFAKNYDNINYIIEDLKNDDYNSVYKSGKYSKSSEVKINYKQNYGTTSENTDNSINKLKLKIDEETDLENAYKHQNIQLLNGEQKKAEIEYLKNDNIYGLKFSDLYNQYITVENSNLKELLKKVGFPEENLDKFPDSIYINDIQNLKFNKEEFEILKNKYLNLVKEKIPEDMYSKKTKQTIIVNDINILTNAYNVTLTKEQLNNIYISLLENLKTDEIILNKINQIKNSFPFNTLEFNNIDSDLSELYTSKIEEIIEKINRTNIGNEEVTITVYENKGVTVKTEIKTTDYEINFEHLVINDEEFSNIIFKEKEAETKNIKLIKKQNSLELTIKNDIESDKKIITVERNNDIKGNKFNKDINIKYEDDRNKIEINYIEEFNILNELHNIQEFNSNNSIKLNELESEQLSELFNEIGERFTKRIDIIIQDVKVEDLQEILKNVGIINDDIKIESGGVVSETEKNRFNSNFEILQGENLKAEEVLNVLNIIKQNVINLQVVSNRELKIEINRDINNEQLVNTLEEFIQKDKSRIYDIKLEYDNETGLVKYIILIMLNKNR